MVCCYSWLQGWAWWSSWQEKRPWRRICLCLARAWALEGSTGRWCAQTLGPEHRTRNTKILKAGKKTTKKNLGTDSLHLLPPLLNTPPTCPVCLADFHTFPLAQRADHDVCRFKQVGLKSSCKMFGWSWINWQTESNSNPNSFQEGDLDILSKPSLSHKAQQMHCWSNHPINF